MTLEFFSNINDSIILIPVRVLFPELPYSSMMVLAEQEAMDTLTNREFYLNQDTFFYCEGSQTLEQGGHKKFKPRLHPWRY